MIPAWRVKLDVIVLSILILFAFCYYLIVGWIPLAVVDGCFVWSAISELFYRRRYKWTTCSVYCGLLVGYLIGLGGSILLDKEIIINVFLIVGLAFCAWFYQKSIRFLFSWINRPRSFWDLA